MKRLLPVLMGFIISCTFQVTHADELVFSDEHWGKPNKEIEKGTGCGKIEKNPGGVKEVFGWLALLAIKVV